ncbi:PHB depolymerase family esterase [uncultured Hyphomonas sp.]|uniref:extracellular catalytic domain type 1 short-chain-length polyhydroxyalkanoate depolymerase n=1 Tax=uncultured Hyphomonas sp. TaxID=225298 RepID=UPI002AAB6C89|nr:PHB depolymerase family esterase [uncultured Hyphomonas sp.]
MASGKTWVATASIALLMACASAEARPLRSGGDRLTEGQITSSGAQRTYEMHRPARLSGPSPLVIMLHGGGGNGKNGAMMTGFNALAEKEGFTVVYPDGSGRRKLLTWNAGHCCAYAMEEDVDDVRFLSDLIDDLVARGIADPRRVYITGMSNGAMMTYRAGRELSGKVAAIAPVVGAMFGDEPPAAHPVPALIITGAKDTHVPASGGHGESSRRLGGPPGDLPYAPAHVAFDYWRGSNGCHGEKKLRQTDVYALLEGRGCRAALQWYVIKDGGHAWPGGRQGSRRGDEPVPDFDASEVIWNFFERQALKGG